MEITPAWMARFEAKYIPEPNSGCWLWTASDNGNGYPVFATRQRKLGFGGYAHRFSYIVFKGPIPEGCEIDHTCMVRCCVNPDHLEAVTHQVNILRSPNTFGGKWARQTQCIHGHPYNEKDTRVNAKGHRWCRACGRVYDKLRRPRKRAKK